jgi:hypothetical protein
MAYDNRLSVLCFIAWHPFGAQAQTTFLQASIEMPWRVLLLPAFGQERLFHHKKQ